MRAEPQAARARRLFFALWPDAAARAAVVERTRSLVARSSGRPVAAERLHVTLAFLGSVAPELAEALARLPGLAVAAFELRLDKLSYRRANRMLWLEPSRVPVELTELERSLWEELAGRGVQREARRYRPHVTLAREAQPVTGSIAPLRWPVADFALVESQLTPGGSHYRTVRVWPLTA